MSSKLREALKEAHAMLKRIHNAYSDSNEDVTIYQLRKTIAAVEPTLAEPLKNCEVGTAEEQKARHYEWCRKHTIVRYGEVNCLHRDMSCALCALRWAQMPYESEVR